MEFKFKGLRLEKSSGNPGPRRGKPNNNHDVETRLRLVCVMHNYLVTMRLAHQRFNSFSFLPIHQSHQISPLNILPIFADV